MDNALLGELSVVLGESAGVDLLLCGLCKSIHSLSVMVRREMDGGKSSSVWCDDGF